MKAVRPRFDGRDLMRRLHEADATSNALVAEARARAERVMERLPGILLAERRAFELTFSQQSQAIRTAMNDENARLDAEADAEATADAAEVVHMGTKNRAAAVEFLVGM